MLESLLIKLQGFMPPTLSKETLIQVLFCEFCEILKNTLFTEQVREIASENIPGW